MIRAALILLLARPVVAATPALDDIRVEEKLGQSVPLELTLRDASGRVVRLADYVRGDKPVLLLLAYYDCPMLCGLLLRGVADALAQLPWRAGDDYRLLTISFGPKDTPNKARHKQQSALAQLGLDGQPARWPFLTAGASAIESISSALGFRAILDERTGQYAHPAVLFVLTPTGRISRYLYGIEFRPDDVKLALLEAGEGKIGSTFERLLRRCYAYDPATRRYALTVTTITRVGALGILGAVGVLLATLWRRERRRRA